MRRLAVGFLGALLLVACSGDPDPTNSPTPQPSNPSTQAVQSPSPSATLSPPDGDPFEVAEHDTLNQPWALEFTPNGDWLLITQRTGELLARNQSTGELHEITGLPDVTVAGQGGLGDVLVIPEFTDSGTIYFSWVEAADGGTGAAVTKAQLDLTTFEITAPQVIWRQHPKVNGDDHFSYRLALDPSGSHLFVSSGERKQQSPAQDRSNNLGSIVRLNLNGSIPADNPFVSDGSQDIWSYGHRNPLGLAFDADRNLWSTEMGPQGGDELNLIEEGQNYGWPAASNGSHYDDTDIPDHQEGDGFLAPKLWWTPSISPGSLMIYDGELFPYWQGDAFIGALSGEALVRVDLSGADATEGDRWDMGFRVREVEQGPDGSIWLLSDGDQGQLLELRPA